MVKSYSFGYLQLYGHSLIGIRWSEWYLGAVDPLACLNLIFGSVKISNFCTNSPIFKCHIILELAIQNLI